MVQSVIDQTGTFVLWCHSSIDAIVFLGHLNILMPGGYQC